MVNIDRLSPVNKKIIFIIIHSFSEHDIEEISNSTTTYKKVSRIKDTLMQRLRDDQFSQTLDNGSVKVDFIKDDKHHKLLIEPFMDSHKLTYIKGKINIQ